MKKYIILIVSGLLFLASCSNKNDLKKKGMQQSLFSVDIRMSIEKVHGKVQTMVKRKYFANEKFGEIEKSKIHESHKLEYDNKGNCVEYDKYGSDGKLEFKYIAKHDDNGNYMGGNSYNSDGALEFVDTLKYDHKGNIVEKYIYNADGNLAKKITFKYDDRGNEIESLAYMRGEESKTTKTSYTHKYDSIGNVVETITYFDGKPLVIEEFEIKYY